MVEKILIAQRDPEDALADQRLDRVFEVVG